MELIKIFVLECRSNNLCKRSFNANYNSMKSNKIIFSKKKRDK